MIRWSDLVASLELFAPETTEVFGKVVLSGNLDSGAKITDPNFDASSYCWIDLVDVISHEGMEGVSNLEIERQLSTLAYCWKVLLVDRYPNRQFSVTVLSPNETGDWYGIGFIENDCGSN